MREECSWLPGPGNRFGLAREQVNLGVSVGGSWLRMQGRALCFAQGAPLRKLWRGILPPSVSNLLSSSLGSWRGVSTPLMEISEETFLKVLPLPVRPTRLGWWMGWCGRGAMNRNQKTQWISRGETRAQFPAVEVGLELTTFGPRHPICTPRGTV